MPVLIEGVENMLDHVRDFFPLDDMCEIFGLHKSATVKATMDLASDIMDRTYRYQFVVKKNFNVQINKDKVDAFNQRIFEYYRSKLIEVQDKIPSVIPKEQYEKDLPIRRNAPFCTFLVKEIEKYNVLLQQIKENLAITKAALEGLL